MQGATTKDEQETAMHSTLAKGRPQFPPSDGESEIPRLHETRNGVRKPCSATLQQSARAPDALFANGNSAAEVSIICSSMPSSRRRGRHRPKACRRADQYKEGLRPVLAAVSRSSGGEAPCSSVTFRGPWPISGKDRSRGEDMVQWPCCLGGVDRVRDGVMARGRAETRQEV